MLRVKWQRLMRKREVIGPVWPWVARSDRRMLPLKTDRNFAVVRMRIPPPNAVIWIRARIRNRKINWQ